MQFQIKDTIKLIKVKLFSKGNNITIHKKYYTEYKLENEQKLEKKNTDLRLNK